jgi:hypothetical protein
MGVVEYSGIATSTATREFPNNPTIVKPTFANQPQSPSTIADSELHTLNG